MVSAGRVAAILGVLALASGCSSITNHRGYINDQVLTASIQPGLDNRTSVRGTLGQPTLTSQFGEPVWYYITSTTEQAPFSRPDVETHSVLAVHFDAAGNVISTERTGLERLARIDPDGDETPTPGRDRGLLEDLFGNIGRVGTGAAPSGPSQ